MNILCEVLAARGYPVRTEFLSRRVAGYPVPDDPIEEVQRESAEAMSRALERARRPSVPPPPPRADMPYRIYFTCGRCDHDSLALGTYEVFVLAHSDCLLEGLREDKANGLRVTCSQCGSPGIVIVAQGPDSYDIARSERKLPWLSPEQRQRTSRRLNDPN